GARCALSVLRSDNRTRVRDGYTRLSTRGHAQSVAPSRVVSLAVNSCNTRRTHWFEPSTAHIRNPLLIVARGPEPAFEFERRRSHSGSPRLDRGARLPPRGAAPVRRRARADGVRLNVRRPPAQRRARAALTQDGAVGSRQE